MEGFAKPFSRSGKMAEAARYHYLGGFLNGIGERRIVMSLLSQVEAGVAPALLDSYSTARYRAIL